MDYRKKLIEVAVPLEAINKESAREKSIRHGHPSTMHLWWARRPLAACRAVLFASVIDDPEQDGVPPALLDRIDRLPLPDSKRLEWPTLTTGEQRRQRLFAFIERLVLWENSDNIEVIDIARELIHAATGGKPPPVLDPFCGGGSIPLEAQRLGLEAHGSDLNPVAVLITKALIEIPPKFAGLPPVNPRDCKRIQAGWPGATGLAADVRHYGQWMRGEAQKRIGHLYPKVKLRPEQGGGDATVIAWLWARTVQCPNPACGARMPLVTSFVLSTKEGKEQWVKPIVDRETKTIRFEIRKSGQGTPPLGPKVGRGAKFRCLVCEQVAPEGHIKAEGMAGRMGTQLMAIVADGRGKRIYLPPDDEHVVPARQARPEWSPEQKLANDPRAIWCVLYGLTTFGDLFTLRQLVALSTISDLVGEARSRVLTDAENQEYADAVATYLAFGASKMVDYNSSLTSWSSSRDQARPTFARQGLPMVWDFAEVNPLGNAAGDLLVSLDGIGETLDRGAVAICGGETTQRDAASAFDGIVRPLISSDPPYYDNIGYADLSDFFYVWLRRSLRDVYPDLFRTMLVPKQQELIASPYRFDGDKDAAQRFFERGLGAAFANMRATQHPDYPLTVYYAFKQAEVDKGDDAAAGEAVASTGWETMLEGLIGAGFSINGTWPMRTERLVRSVGLGTNALASSIVLVCRPRLADAHTATRRDFLAALRRELPKALHTLQQGNIAPVDLQQAAIGPGMAVFSRYRQVLDAGGKPLSVRVALSLINGSLLTAVSGWHRD